MKKSDKHLTWQRKSLIDELYFVNKCIKFYTKILDYSAYTLLLVVADAVENFDKDSLRLRSNEYLGLGKWVEDYLEAAGAPGYSPYKYIGEDAHDVASWFETLK